MKILHFICDGAPGGGANHVNQLLTGLSPDAECVLLTQKDSYLAEKAEGMGIEVHTGDFFRSRTDRDAIDCLKKTIDSVQPDVLHNHGGNAAFFSSLLPKEIPSVYTVHGFHFARKPVLAKTMGWVGELRSIRGADHVVFVSHHDAKIAKQYRLLPASKSSQVIHNGIGAPNVPAVARRKAIGFVGRFVHQKHPELFVQMMKHLRGVKAVMVGGGELDESVRQEIQAAGLENQIECLGSLGHAEALQVLASLDVLVMTPRWEGLPLLPLEAMMMNVPVVSTSVGGIPEVINHMEHGMLVDTRSPVDLADCVAMMLEDDSFRKQIVKDARHRAETEFAESAMLTKLDQMYSGLAREANLNSVVAASVASGFLEQAGV